MKNKDYFLPIGAGAVISTAAVIAMLFISKPGALLCAVLSATLLTIFAVVTRRRYRKISLLNNYLALVCAGNYTLAPEENAEGELSILQNNLLKVISQLRTQNEVIESDKKYLADSLTDISHQLKTPLTSLLVISELLEKEESPKRRREFTGMIGAQCERMSWLIQTLLKLSKLDAGTTALSSDTLSVSELVDGSLAPFMLTLDLRNIRVVKSIQNYSLIADKNWTIEALQNIIKNCIEHTPDGGQLTITADETTVFHRIILRDNGSGIAAEDLPHIFERFYHGKNASTESVGIGLALSKTIFNKQNAAITVTSEEGGGTEFEIKFYKAVV